MFMSLSRGTTKVNSKQGEKKRKGVGNGMVRQKSRGIERERKGEGEEKQERVRRECYIMEMVNDMARANNNVLGLG